MIYYDTIHTHSYFSIWYCSKTEKLFTIYAVKGKYWKIYKKTLPDHNLRREFAVGAVAVISHNIWKSKLYINTEGQLFWYLNTFKGYISRLILAFDIVTILRTTLEIYWRLVVKLCCENCCFGCRLWLLGQFQRLVCKLILKGLVPSHSAESFDFSRWGIINIRINFDWHYKGLWTWSSSSN